MTPGLLCMPSSGLHSLRPPPPSQTHKCFWALSIVHCCCGLLRPLLLPGWYIYIERNLSFFLVYILFRAAPVCLCVCSSHSHSPTPTSFRQYCCLCYISLRLSVFSCALCLAASESVLLRQLFQSKLTQTGSLVPTAQGRTGFRGPKAALFYKMPSASLVTASAVPSKPQRSLDLTRVQFIQCRQPRE